MKRQFSELEEYHVQKLWLLEHHIVEWSDLVLKTRGHKISDTNSLAVKMVIPICVSEIQVLGTYRNGLCVYLLDVLRVVS